MQNTTDTSPASTQNLAANEVTYLSLLKEEQLSPLEFTLPNSICFKTNYYVSASLKFLSVSYSPTTTWKNIFKS